MFHCFLFFCQNLEQILQHLVAKNAELQEHLTRKESELDRVGETIMREQQQVLEETRREKGQLQEQLRLQVSPDVITITVYCDFLPNCMCRRQSTGS